MDAGQVPWIEPLAARRVRRAAFLLGVAALGVACVGEPARSIRQSAEGRIPSALRPDELPAVVNDRTPFIYPQGAWDQRIQGNVMLRLHVDANGTAVRESTTVAGSSGVPALDSAALASVSRLRFRPGRRSGVPVGVSLLFPVHYRHPEGPPLPGDTLP
jgi:TonB family protein